MQNSGTIMAAGMRTCVAVFFAMHAEHYEVPATLTLMSHLQA
jgi:hypothetical protein